MPRHMKTAQLLHCCNCNSLCVCLGMHMHVCMFCACSWWQHPPPVSRLKHHVQSVTVNWLVCDNASLISPQTTGMNLSVCLYVYMYVYMSIFLSVCLSVCLSLCMCVSYHACAELGVYVALPLQTSHAECMQYLKFLRAQQS